MGRATRLLRIGITDQSLLPWFQDMIEHGHAIELVDLSAFDYVIGPACHRLTPSMLGKLPKKMLPDLIKEVRITTYGPKGNKRVQPAPEIAAKVGIPRGTPEDPTSAKGDMI